MINTPHDREARYTYQARHFLDRLQGAGHPLEGVAYVLNHLSITFYPRKLIVVRQLQELVRHTLWCSLLVSKCGRKDHTMSMTNGQLDEYQQGDNWQVQEMTVQGSDGLDIGHVVQVHPNGGNVLVERPGGSELATLVPMASIQDVSGNQITLRVPADQVDQQGWEEAPIPGINV